MPLAVRGRALIAAMLLLSHAAVASDEPLPALLRDVIELRQLDAAAISIHVRDLASGEVLLTHHADTPRNPASTMKALTTLVALDRLGPSYRWYTELYALGEIRDGRLDGDLLLKGYGDPFLVTERVWQMLRALRRRGVHHVDGDLLIDDSYFAPVDEDPGSFDRQPLRVYNVTPSAVLMNFKSVRYWFEPADGGDAVVIDVDPPLPNLTVENRLRLRGGRCRGYQRGISITPAERNAVMIFEGGFPNGCRRYALDRTVLSHAEFAWGLISTLWRDMGGTLGGWRHARVPDDAEPLLRFPSLSLAEIIARVNKHSNNVMARHLLLTLAAEAGGPPADEAAGRAEVDAWLRENLPAVDSVVLENGAGRSRDARISAEDFASILDFAWRQAYMPEFAASLAVSGHDGTLRERFGDNGLAGHAHLKTGSLDHVAAIAGYMQSRSGRRYSVVVLHNEQDAHRGYGEELQHALLRWLYAQ